MDIRKQGLAGGLLLLACLALPTSAAADARAESGGVAIDGNVENSPITIGVSGAELLKLIEAERSKTAAPLQAQIDALAKQAGVSEAAMRNFLRILGEKEIPAEKLVERFTDILQRHRGSLQRLAALDPADPAIKTLIEQARAAVQQGDYDAADRLLAEAENADLAAARQAEQLAEQAKAAAHQRLLAAAATRAERGDLAMARIDYLSAAEHYSNALMLSSFSGENDEKYVEYLWRRSIAFYRYGDEFGSVDYLFKAVFDLKKVLSLIMKEHDPLFWVDVKNSIGSVFLSIGESELDLVYLEEAVAAYRDALKERARERAPLAWAAMQNNLGNALLALGRRENGIARFEDAIESYGAALNERKRERDPLAWAETKNNLGNALLMLGERSNDDAKLIKAVSVYQEALSERIHDRSPLEWAATQNNLGNALSVLGEHVSGIKWLQDAVEAYRLSLNEYTRERVPLIWAEAQNNLGVALWRIGERELDDVYLKEALDALNLALSERTRGRVPLKWAETQYNLGNVLKTIGEREPGTTRLEEAAVIYHSVLGVFRAARATYYVGLAEGSLRKVEDLLAARRR